MIRYNMRDRRTVTKAYAESYRKANKKPKAEILSELSEAMGYNRQYASYLLRNIGRKIVRMVNGKRTIIEIGDNRFKTRRKRGKKYHGTDLIEKLQTIWAIMDMACGKRLKPMMAEMICKLEKFEEMTLSPEIRKQLLAMSAATIDRLLREEKRKINKPRSKTKPGTLIKSQVAVRTFEDWDEKVPGFIEIDLVSHDGGSASGDFCLTLNATNVATGWTEAGAVINKAQRWVFEALKSIRAQLPFELKGIDSDNGSEFINHHLIRYTDQGKITFTRSRVYKKNDNCYIEQKNYSVIRKLVGYQRYEGLYHLELLNKLYMLNGIFNNSLMPSTKLIEKKRIGSKIYKKYDTPKTPFQRLMETNSINEDTKQRIQAIYQSINPAKLRREILCLQDKLMATAKTKTKIVSSRKLIEATNKLS